jgi:hypothetical protein
MLLVNLIGEPRMKTTYILIRPVDGNDDIGTWESHDYTDEDMTPLVVARYPRAFSVNNHVMEECYGSGRRMVATSGISYM